MFHRLGHAFPSTRLENVTFFSYNNGEDESATKEMYTVPCDSIPKGYMRFYLGQPLSKGPRLHDAFIAVPWADFILRYPANICALAMTADESDTPVISLGTAVLRYMYTFWRNENDGQKEWQSLTFGQAASCGEKVLSDAWFRSGTFEQGLGCECDPTPDDAHNTVIPKPGLQSPTTEGESQGVNGSKNDTRPAPGAANTAVALSETSLLVMLLTVGLLWATLVELW